MKIEISLTPEQVSLLASSVNDVTSDIAKSNEFLKATILHLLTDEGEEVEKKLNLQTASARHGSNIYAARDVAASMPTVRKTTMKAVVDALSKSVLETSKDEIQQIMVETRAAFLAELPNVLIRAYMAQSLHVMQSALQNVNMTSPFTYEQVELIKQRMGLA